VDSEESGREEEYPEDLSQVALAVGQSKHGLFPSSSSRPAARPDPPSAKPSLPPSLPPSHLPTSTRAPPQADSLLQHLWQLRVADPDPISAPRSLMSREGGQRGRGRGGERREVRVRARVTV
jgi:hypothetical protein